MQKYKKIKYIGTSENGSLFDNKDDEIVIEEKIDGSNFRFWKEDGEIIYGSRNVHGLDKDNEQFKEIIDYLEGQLEISKIDRDLIYVGEAMIKHSLDYDWDKYPAFIGYEVLHKDTGLPLGFETAVDKITTLDLSFVNIKFLGTVRELEKKDWRTSLLETSKYREGKPEGIVIKNYNRLNQYGRPLFGKVVNKEFQEKKEAKFGQSQERKRSTPLIVEEYATEPRIKKQIWKLVNEKGEPLGRELMRYLIPMTIKDILEENIIEIYDDKRVKKIDFYLLNKLVPERCLKVLDNVIERQVGI